MSLSLYRPLSLFVGWFVRQLHVTPNLSELYRLSIEESRNNSPIFWTYVTILHKRTFHGGHSLVLYSSHSELHGSLSFCPIPMATKALNLSLVILYVKTSENEAHSPSLDSFGLFPATRKWTLPLTKRVLCGKRNGKSVPQENANCVHTVFDNCFFFVRVCED